MTVFFVRGSVYYSTTVGFDYEQETITHKEEFRRRSSM